MILSIKSRLTLASLVVSALMMGCSGGTSQDQAPKAGQSAEAVSVKLIAINDFHGRLKTDPDDRGASVTIKDGATVKSVRVGGAAFLSTLVNELKSTTPYSMVVAAGDIIGASQPIAGLTSEEGAIDVMNQIGLEVSSVGNHEFDARKDELLRMQNGGCKPTGQIGKTTCITNSQSAPDGKFGGAKFKYLAANVIDDATQKPLFDGTFVKKFGPATVGFVGLTLQGTPNATGGAIGLTFQDEATVINEKSAELKKNGADAVVVLIHQGGQTSASYIDDQTCPGMTGLLQPIVAKLRNVDVVVSGHTHQEYICRDQTTGTLYTSAGLYGRMVTDIDLKIVPGQGVVEKTAKTIPVINDLNKPQDIPAGYKILTANPETQKVIDAYDKATSGTLQEVRGYTSAMISNCGRTQSMEIPMGDVMADAFLEAYLSTNKTVKNVVAFTNPGGLRDSIAYVNNGAVTYNALYTVAPFGNNLVYKDLTGAQLKRLLEQQWEAKNCSVSKLPKTDICGRMLQPSRTLRYTRDWARGQGKPDGIGAMLVSVEVLDTTTNTWNPVVDTETYRVVANDFLAKGGDNFSAFSADKKEGVDFGKNDLEALVAYFETTKAAGQTVPLPKPTPRATCLNCPPLAPEDAARCDK
jgi:5'-nucleotidase